jgi:hypothetical protein
MFANVGFMFIIGGLMLMIANVGGIGYGLYLWGGTGMAFSLAAWTAFKFWMIWVALGLASILFSIFRTK